MSDHVDVLIVGAGLSGIGAAYRLQERNPGVSYTIVEARDEMGGTWDLFRYPGVRSDSDFYTLSFPFRPWRGDDAIVDGQEILDYIRETADAYGITERIRFSTKVVSAAWSSTDARWTVGIEDSRTGEQSTITASFLETCAGYYDYEQPFDPQFAGLEDFEGQVVHPQFWPDDLDYTGKRVVVVGSGATAITVVPAMADDAAHVTMLQRTPTWVLAQPKHDAVGDALRKVLPAKAAHSTIRAKNAVLQWGLYQFSRRAPEKMAGLLRKGAVAGLGSEQVVVDHFTPPYGPWEQRLCIAPGGDLFEAVRSGRASVVTGHIDRFVPEGILLTDGETIEADVVVTATGLSLKLIGGIDLSVDGEPVDPAGRMTFRGLMLSGVPNFSYCIGYVNLSWTMRADMTARYVARVVERLRTTAADTVTPTYTGPPSERPMIDMQSGYFVRAAHLMPRSADAHPWTMKHNYVVDAWHTNRANLDDGLVWSGAATRTSGGATRAAAGKGVGTSAIA
ncbi:cation diffusion facilitator CzcD-associated flavoprotein CzcO [Mumia flava]|uniref:Cation diffusion facilitator CzcD-associated flavoprotein CzcO n=1 Tax=Mumia flava TaxID=1348852 RepID=A0A0B2BPP4_9ACTN|nr:NAD(P)/FAD-dependent oxidoreductase [Mumia flava]PJJ57055.1 cation diffusion facilitator CzcD-associated flavoprotein CzcO [Mumia flava]